MLFVHVFRRRSCESMDVSLLLLQRVFVHSFTYLICTIASGPDIKLARRNTDFLIHK